MSDLTRTTAQIVAWIKRVEKFGIVPEGTWDLSRSDVLKLNLRDEIAEVKRLLNTIQSPDLEELLTIKLERLEQEVRFMERTMSDENEAGSRSP